MPLIKDVFRALPGGDAIASKVATVKKLVDLATVAPSSGDMTSGSDGVFSGTFGYLGPYKYTISDGDTTKEHSSLSQGQVGSWWPAEAPFIFAALGDGMVDDAALKVTASGSDMTVSVAAGAALVDGHPYVWDTAQSLTIPAADATNPRIDRIILRLYAPGNTEQGRIDLLVLKGTAAATPSAPGLEQDLVTDKLYEISLAQVYVDAAATSIAADKVTDERGRLTLPPPDGSVGLAKLTPTGTSGQVLTSTGSSTAPTYQDLPPSTPPDGSVTTAKLVDANVTLAKLAANSVDASKIVDGSVGTAELAANAVSPAKLSRTGTAGQVLTSNGTGADPSYQTLPEGNPVLQDGIVRGYAFGSVNSAGGTDIASLTKSVTVPNNGVHYEFTVNASVAASAPSGAGGEIFAALNFDGSVVNETSTQTVGGERTLATTAKGTIVGDGAVHTFAVHMRTTGGSDGGINQGVLSYQGIPRK